MEVAPISSINSSPNYGICFAGQDHMTRKPFERRRMRTIEVVVTRQRSLIIWVGLTIVTLFTQYRSGAYHADFARDPDEPAHAVSALMVHDYLVQAFPANPIRFAHTFSDHYPKVAIGHWPPLFYCLEGSWMLLFGRTRAALLLFVALCGITLAGSVYFMVRRLTSTPIAWLSVAVLMCSPLFLSLVCSVRPDLLLALLVFWAAISITNYMVSRQRNWLISCLVLGAMAMLVHGRGAVLLLLPFSVLLVERRRMTWKWMVAAAVLAFVIAWPHLIVPESHLTLSSFLRLLRVGVLRTALNLEWLPAIAAVAAILQVTRSEARQPFWTAMACLAISNFCFDLMVPLSWSDDNLLIAALPAWAALAGYGVQHLCAQLVVSGRAKPSSVRVALMAVALSGLVLTSIFVPRKHDPGFHQLVASTLLTNADPVLIAANGLNEGALIAESSLADPARMHTILRGSKVLSESTWGGNRYHPRFASSPAMQQFLQSAHVCLAIVQIADPVTTDQQQLRSALNLNATWALVSSGPQIQGLEIYRRTHDAGGHCG